MSGIQSPRPTTPPIAATGAASDQPQRLLDAHEHAAAYFADHLHSEAGRGPREYLCRRGIAQLLRAPGWAIGYAPPGWMGLTDHLRGAGFDDDEIVRAGFGLVSRNDRVVDRFRDRVTFGIRTPAGDLVGFTARSAPAATGGAPKYLNSPRTPIYGKAAVLFGLAEQHEPLTRGAIPVLVEGPFDVLAVAAACQRSENPLVAVAPCGTALTDHHADLLATAGGTGQVLVAYDSDAAGDRAAATAYHQLTSRVSQLSAARLPPATDPSDLLAHVGPMRLRAAMADTEPLADRVVDCVLRRYRDLDDNAEARVAALHQAAPLIASMRPAEAGREVARIARALGFDHPLVTEQVTTALTEQTAGRRASTAARRPGPSTGQPPRSARADPMRLP